MPRTSKRTGRPFGADFYATFATLVVWPAAPAGAPVAPGGGGGGGGFRALSAATVSAPMAGGGTAAVTPLVASGVELLARLPVAGAPTRAELATAGGVAGVGWVRHRAAVAVHRPSRRVAAFGGQTLTFGAAAAPLCDLRLGDVTLPTPANIG